MTRDEAIEIARQAARSTALQTPFAPDWVPPEWALVAIRRAAGPGTIRPEPSATVGGLTVTLQNSGGMLFKVAGAPGVGGRGVGKSSSVQVVADTLRRAADDLWPVAAKPGPSAPPCLPLTAPTLGFVSCCGNLTIEALSLPAPAGECGFDIVVNAARTNRAPERVGFRWSSDQKDAAKDLRRLADCL